MYGVAEAVLLGALVMNPTVSRGKSIPRGAAINVNVIFRFLSAFLAMSIDWDPSLACSGFID